MRLVLVGMKIVYVCRSIIALEVQISNVLIVPSVPFRRKKYDTIINIPLWQVAAAIIVLVPLPLPPVTRQKQTDATSTTITKT
ncbi:hypothetical protein BCV72DRAFT_235809 [Rhizopus microsporus var. microsporus]|uniref:Uncharacterized protein n=1 Tax=Rhizopus microsporus var. microsporus TaxID=86635 RepID=A0A1X0QPN8_RHIZD|nr:hypothetical protein BCV72DRAFT_235809 [Rhizopus microsporus var. microsporus]